VAITGICELVLESRDPERLATFYELLGLERLDEHDDKIWLVAGERSRLGIWPPGPQEHDDQGGRHVHFALAASPGTIDELAEALQGEGVELEGPIEHEGGDRSVYFSDPEGNRVELWDFLHRDENEGIRALAN